MEPTEKEIEVRLRELGIRLASPPHDVGELLYLLDQTEIYLSRVEQSPSASMFDAMRPAMNSLIVKEFLSHPDADVKVFVAACFNEIIRITAPDAPYDDALMKEIFALIVDAFKKLDDLSGCSYAKRVSILEIMAKVCSCVVMLDLECDDLILQMFKILLSSIRPNHPTNVFSSMEVIMTLILEESEDVSQELAICLLSNVQKSKKGVMPVTCELAKKVIHNCATKLKPYFLVAVQTMGISLNDYCGIVAAICQERPVTLEQNKVGGNKLSEKAILDELPQKVDKPGSCLEEVGTSADKTKIALSNGGILLGNENPAVEPIFPESQPDVSFSSEHCRNDRGPRAENNDLVFVTEKSGNEQNLQYKKARLSSAQLEDASDSSWVDGEKESFDPTVWTTNLKKQTARSLESDNVSEKAPITEVLVEFEKDTEVQPLECIADDYMCANSVSPSCGSPGVGLPIRRPVTNFQFNEIKEASNKPSATLGKEKMQIITLTEKGDSGDLPAILFNNKNNCCVSNLDGKSSNDSDKTSYENNAMADVAALGTGGGKSSRDEQKGTISVIVVDKIPLEDNATVDVIAAGISDGNSLRDEQKEVSSVVSNANSFRNQWQFNKNQQMDKGVTKEVESADPCLREMIASANTSGETNNDQNVWVKLGDVERCREVNRKYNIYLEIIGRKIEVWWPDDMMFYKGVIDAFDPITKKHRVLYDDGDEEILFLKTERWNYIDSDNFEDGQENYIAGAESSLQVTKEMARVSSSKSKATRKRGRFGRRKFFLNPIEQLSLSNSKKSTSEAATLPAPNDPPRDEAVSDGKYGERLISQPGDGVSARGAELEPERTNESANQGASEDAGAPKLGETSKSRSLDGETLRKDVGIQVEISQAAACSYDTSVVSMASDGLKIRWKRKRVDGGIIDASVSAYKSCEGKDI